MNSRLTGMPRMAENVYLLDREERQKSVLKRPPYWFLVDFLDYTFFILDFYGLHFLATRLIFLV